MPACVAARVRGAGRRLAAPYSTSVDERLVLVRSSDEKLVETRARVQLSELHHAGKWYRLSCLAHITVISWMSAYRIRLVVPDMVCSRHFLIYAWYIRLIPHECSRCGTRLQLRWDCVAH